MADKPEYLPAHAIPGWVGEHDAINLLKDVLNEVVEEHGNKAKAICWDVSCKFKQRIRNIAQ